MSRTVALATLAALLLAGCATRGDANAAPANAPEAGQPLFVDRTNATAAGGGTGESCFNAFGPMGGGTGEVAVNRDGDSIRFEFRARPTRTFDASLRVTLTPSDDTGTILGSGTSDRLVTLDLAREDLGGVRHVAFHAYVCDARTGVAPMDVEVAASFFATAIPEGYTAFPSIRSSAR